MWLIIILNQESGVPADAQVLLPLSGSDLPLPKGEFFTIVLILTFVTIALFVTFVTIVLIVICFYIELTHRDLSSH